MKTTSIWASLITMVDVKKKQWCLVLTMQPLEDLSSIIYILGITDIEYRRTPRTVRWIAFVVNLYNAHVIFLDVSILFKIYKSICVIALEKNSNCSLWFHYWLQRSILDSSFEISIPNSDQIQTKLTKIMNRTLIFFNSLMSSVADKRKICVSLHVSLHCWN